MLTNLIQIIRYGSIAILTSVFIWFAVKIWEFGNATNNIDLELILFPNAILYGKYVFVPPEMYSDHNGEVHSCDLENVLRMLNLEVNDRWRHPL